MLIGFLYTEDQKLDGERLMDGTAQIHALVAPWSQAILERDWDALLSICTEDIVFDPPGEPQVPPDELRTWLDEFPVITAFNWGLDQVEMSGNMATGFGHGSMTVKVEGEKVAMTIKFAPMFRRSEDGSWRFSRVIWNQNEPSGPRLRPFLA
tara:strand:- start:218 stop:673 length:456 start_codon:yes stop_codon:yes gene_type:complete